MIFIIAVILFTHLLAIAAIVITFRTIKSTNPYWLINNLIAVAIFSFVYFAGIWALTSIYFKYFYAIVLLIAILISGIFQFAYRKTSSYKEAKEQIKTQSLVLKSILFLGLVVLNYLVIKGFYQPEENAVDIAFPLNNGIYYIYQGGDSPITNGIHRRRKSQTYAYDIVKLGPTGARAKGIIPEELDKYYIFLDTVYAPFDGVVTEVVDGQENNIPPEMNTDHPLGNYIIFSDSTYFILLAHFHPNSIMVQQGEHIKKGTPIGLIGNSGRSIEPHLHIQAMATQNKGEKRFKGKGLPLKFNGQTYSLNSIIKSTKNKNL